VGEGGLEPPRPHGHTDLNRARLPFRHSPEWSAQPSRGSSDPNANAGCPSSVLDTIDIGTIWAPDRAAGRVADR
jgi:hypothetical protein